MKHIVTTFVVIVVIISVIDCNISKANRWYGSGIKWNHSTLSKSMLRSNDAELLTFVPSEWSKSVRKSLLSKDTYAHSSRLNIDEIIYLPSILTRATGINNVNSNDNAIVDVYDDDHLCSKLCDKGYLVSVYNANINHIVDNSNYKNALGISEIYVKGLIEILTQRKSAGSNICVIAEELSISFLLSFLGNRSHSMLHNNLISCIVLKDPPDMNAYSDNDGRLDLLYPYAKDMVNQFNMGNGKSVVYSKPIIDLLYSVYNRRVDSSSDSKSSQIDDTATPIMTDDDSDIGPAADADADAGADGDVERELQLIINSLSTRNFDDMPEEVKRHKKKRRIMNYIPLTDSRRKINIDSNIDIKSKANELKLIDILGARPCTNAFEVGKNYKDRILVLSTLSTDDTDNDNDDDDEYSDDKYSCTNHKACEELSALYAAGPVIRLCDIMQDEALADVDIDSATDYDCNGLNTIISLDDKDKSIVTDTDTYSQKYIYAITITVIDWLQMLTTRD